MYPCRVSSIATWIPEQEDTHGKLQRIGASWISGSISFQKELSTEGTAYLRRTWIKGVSMDLKEHWKEDEKYLYPLPFTLLPFVVYKYCVVCL